MTIAKREKKLILYTGLVRLFIHIIRVSSLRTMLMIMMCISSSDNVCCSAHVCGGVVNGRECC